jgi:FOG: EAL domain
MIMKIMIRLKAFLKKNQIIGRYSETSSVLLPETSLVEKPTRPWLVKSPALFLQPFKAANYEFEIAMSMGISLYTEEPKARIPMIWPMKAVRFLIKQANIALLWAKKEGPNKFKFYCTDFSIQNYKQFELRSDFIKAIYQSQFEIFYQPIVTLKETKILVAEALIRWNHPVWGLVSPDEFIYLSEETGSIIEMEKWMLNEVCQSCNKTLNEGFPKQNVMVNFSSIQFYEKSFALTIKEILTKFSLDPKFLIVKVTEDLLLDDSENIRNNLKELRSMGIKIALNDPNFSFIGLQNFNIDILILDGSFLNNVLTVTASASIVQSIIELTRQLNIKLVAVGIDNWEQKAFLEKLNCYAGQGDFYSKPLPKDEYKTILKTGISDPEPLLPQNTYAQLVDERRNYFRLFFNRYVRADLAILQIKDKQMGVGNTKVLIQDIGPGGLCFISNIQFPIEQGFTLQFETSLLNNKIKVYGNPMHMKKFNNHLYQYGVKFSINEDERDELTKILFEIQTIVKRNTIFEDSSFTFDSPSVYFKGLANQ